MERIRMVAGWNKITRAQGEAVLLTLATGLAHQRILDKSQLKKVMNFTVTLIGDETDIVLVKDILAAAGKERELEIFSESLVEYLLSTRPNSTDEPA